MGYNYRYLIYNFYFESGIDGSDMIFYNMAARMYSTNLNNSFNNYNAVKLTSNSNISMDTPSSDCNDNLIICETSQSKGSSTSPCSCISNI